MSEDAYVEGCFPPSQTQGAPEKSGVAQARESHVERIQQELSAPRDIKTQRILDTEFVDETEFVGERRASKEAKTLSSRFVAYFAIENTVGQSFTRASVDILKRQGYREATPDEAEWFPHCMVVNGRVKTSDGRVAMLKRRDWYEEDKAREMELQKKPLGMKAGDVITDANKDTIPTMPLKTDGDPTLVPGGSGVVSIPA